ncbi:unnamed protein product [Schistosoma turkestanicum]|nr:unnamed protein product [Schistosoma turkestanicum]
MFEGEDLEEMKNAAMTDNKRQRSRLVKELAIKSGISETSSKLDNDNHRNNSESLPITKIPLPNGQHENTSFDFRSCSRHILFSGTSVIQTRGDINKRVLAVVIRTGFMTTKGELVRSIMFPKPMKFKFTQDAYQFLGALCAVALVFLCITIYLMYWNNKDLYYIILRPLDIVTIVIPPILPVAMSVGIVFAQRRLRNHGIYCINPSVMNVCGVINLTCFDKTGTLTEDGLDLWGVIPNKDGVLGKPEFEPSKLGHGPLIECMATCDHMLTSLSVARDCEMIDELDRVVIVTAHPPPHPSNYFTSDMLNENQPISMADTGFSTETNPNHISDTTDERNDKNFSDDLINSLVQFHYAEDLNRPVTEVATTKIQLKRNQTKTDNVETSKTSLFKRIKTKFNFSGSQSSSKVLAGSLTGDDVMYDTDSKDVFSQEDVEKCLYDRSTKNRCSLSIRMIDRPDFHLAMSGNTWSVIREHYPWLIPKLVVKGTVFARFSPEQKAQVIEALQSVGYYVSMCGDGANDCGALKAGHVGISLSEAEASIASPFTSKKQNISCVPMLIREGRCALVTSFGMFKFMAGYSLIQSFSVMLLYIVGSNFSQWQYLHCDFVIITTLGLTFGYTHAYPYLSAEPPTMRLLSTVTMISLFGQVIIDFIIQTTAFILIRFQSWYMPLYLYSNISDYETYESTAVFIVSAYQYIILAIAFSKGAPYRKSILTNYAFVLNILVCFAFTLYLTTNPADWIVKLLELVRIPSIWFICILHFMVLANFMASYIVESVVDGVAFRRRISRIRQSLFPRRVERKAYERIREEIDRSAGVWPPLLRSASLQELPRDLFADDNIDIPTRRSSRRHSSAISYDTDVEAASVQSEITDKRQIPFSSTDGDIGLPKIVGKSFSNRLSLNENRNPSFDLHGSLKKRNLSLGSLHHTTDEPEVFDHRSVSRTSPVMDSPNMKSVSSHLKNEEDKENHDKGDCR